MVTEPPRLDAERTQRALDRLVEGIVKLFGSSKPKSQTAPSAGPSEASATAQAPAPASPPQRSNGDALEQTLARFETMPQEMSELRRTLTDVLHNFGMAIDHMGIEAKRLSNESSSLALMADKLQMRLDDLQRVLNGDFAERRTAPVVIQDEPAEPQFRPTDQGVSLVIASVPGYQGLIKTHSALSDLPEAEDASVTSYKNEEGAFRLVLRTPITAGRIVDALAQSTGEELLIEESRPDAQRLRLRFVEGEGRR